MCVCIFSSKAKTKKHENREKRKSKQSWEFCDKISLKVVWKKRNWPYLLHLYLVHPYLIDLILAQVFCRQVSVQNQANEGEMWNFLNFLYICFYISVRH